MDYPVSKGQKLEAEVIRCRYGLSGRLPQTQRQVAAAFGISRSYVSRRAYCKRPERLGLKLKIVSAAKNDRPIINSTCPYFGYKKFRYPTKFYVVLSGSMEPTYHTGSLLYVKSVDPADLQVGDPITFMLNEDTVATHRIIEILPDQEDSSVLRFRTQGDANDAPDGTPVHYKNIIGKPVFSVPYLGYFANFVQNPPGLYFAIGFAVVLVLLVFLPDLLDDSDKKGKGKGKGDGAAPTAHD